MNELMIHVERIVRPVRATQRRKLRMRRELLAHMLAAFEEERHRFPGDERGAIEQATLRLGEPAELTATLQRTVPLVERVLLARLPMSRGFENWERRAARRLYGKRSEMTLGHISVLSLMAMLALVPLLMSLLFALKNAAAPTPDPLFVLGMLIGWPALLVASYRFVFAAATPDAHLPWFGTLRRGAVVLALQIALICLAVAAIVNRSPTIREIVTCASATVVFLAVSTLVARWIGVLRRPYDEWLTLKIAE
jgi:hypothetical protein